MEGYTKALKKLLREFDCYFVRQGKGDHEIWFSPITNRQVTVDGTNMSRHTANAALKQAGIQRKL
jgi:ribosomal protein L16/L10AE